MARRTSIAAGRRGSLVRLGSGATAMALHEAEASEKAASEKATHASKTTDVLRRESATRASIANKSSAKVDSDVHPHDEFSTQERQEIQEHHRRMVIGISIAVAAALVIVVALVGLGWYTGTPAALFHRTEMRGYSLTAILRKSCFTDACRTAVAMLNASIDATANPCLDVYQYTCGKWRTLDHKGQPLTYEQDLNYRYVNAINANITAGATADALCRNVEPKAKMGCIYTSCVAFYTSRSSSLADLLTAAKINPKEWMSIRDHVKLFDLVVSTILQTNVTSVLNITMRDPRAAVIEIGMCISCSSSEDDFLQFILDQAVAIKVVDSKSVQRLFADFVRLDGSLKKVHAATPGAPVQEAQHSMLDTVNRLTWQKALVGSNAGFKVKADELQLLSSNSDGVGKFVAALFNVHVELARLYELLAPVAPYMALEHFEAKRRASTKPFTAWSKCIDNVAFLFTVPFDTAVASWLGTEKAAVYFNNMWTSVRLAGTSALHLGTDLDLSRDDLMAASLGDQEISGLSDAAFDEKYDGDFLANLLRYQRLGRRHFQAYDYRSDVSHRGLSMPDKLLHTGLLLRGRHRGHAQLRHPRRSDSCHAVRNGPAGHRFPAGFVRQLLGGVFAAVAQAGRKAKRLAEYHAGPLGRRGFAGGDPERGRHEASQGGGRAALPAIRAYLLWQEWD
ncbi:hypothetical protein MTO96_048870 [Rhipicephalus appendiculatus]